MTTLFTKASEIKEELKNISGNLGFVPTMGALHEGHISLINTAKTECKNTIVSIFVNPTQFAPNEDFNSYPRNINNDLRICKELHVDYVYAPAIDDIYPEGIKNCPMITPPESLSKILCGVSRPNHFSGVATVVKRLFEIINPDYAYFGEKDLQQLYIIRWLVNEYKISTFPRACPIIREKSGLALSSRNCFLTDDEKKIAANLYISLVQAKRNVKSGIFFPQKACLESLIFLSKFPEIKVEYFEARNKNEFQKVTDATMSDFYFLLAAKVGNVRLIDNIEV